MQQLTMKGTYLGGFEEMELSQIAGQDGDVVSLLSRDFLKPVLAALVVATPVAWYASHRWWQAFAYRIEITWWMFVVAGWLTVGIALLTVSVQSIRAALMNPVKSLRSEQDHTHLR